jgi:hypothetical protein
MRVSLPPEGAASSDLTIPGNFEAPSGGGESLPSPLYTPLGGLLLTLLVAFLVLTACGFLLTSAKGSWVKTRLAPHVEGTRKSRRKKKGERMAAFAGLFRATEQAFGHRRVWMKLQRVLERADVPLRTVEFAYIMLGSAFVFAFLAVLMGRSSVGILIALGVGAAVPYMWVSFKAKRRMNAFENQLPDLLVTLAASLKAGHSFKQGIQTIVDGGSAHWVVGPAHGRGLAVMSDCSWARGLVLVDELIRRDQAIPRAREQQTTRREVKRRQPGAGETSRQSAPASRVPRATGAPHAPPSHVAHRINARRARSGASGSRTARQRIHHATEAARDLASSACQCASIHLTRRIGPLVAHELFSHRR